MSVLEAAAKVTAAQACGFLAEGDRGNAHLVMRDYLEDMAEQGVPPLDAMQLLAGAAMGLAVRFAEGPEQFKALGHKFLGATS